MIQQREFLGKQLKKARLARHLKQECLASYLQIPVSAVSAMERGKRRIDAEELYLISKFLNKPMTWFFDGREVLSIESVREN